MTETFVLVFNAALWMWVSIGFVCGAYWIARRGGG